MRALQLGSAKVAHAYLRAELGLWPVQLRVLQSTLLLFGQLKVMPASRLAAHVFRNRCAEVQSGDAQLGKYSWCVVAKQALEAEGFGQFWLQPLPRRWPALVKRHCKVKLKSSTRAEVHAHHSLELLNRVSSFSGVEDWLKIEVRHPGRALKVRLRAGALPLMVHVGVANNLKDRSLRQCVMCRTGEVETEAHFVADCPYYQDLRERCLVRLQGLFDAAGESQPRLDFLELIAGSGSSKLPASVRVKAEKCAWDFLRLAWRRRDLIWQRVCLDGNPWRLPAPR